MKRRQFIKVTTGSTLVALVGTSQLLTACHTEEDMIGEPNWIVEGAFNRQLVIPPVVTGDIQLTAKAISGEMLNDKATSMLSYRDGMIGPLIIANKGDTVNVKLMNYLLEQTNIHWHGLILPADMDGHPKDVTSTGGELQYVLPIQQRGGTYWYHPHPHGSTARQVFMGLAGMFLVRDQEELGLQLPSGEFELPLIIQDKRFDGSALDYSPTDEEIILGYLGEQIVVNGISSPVASVANVWHRLRLLNGSTARVYNLSFSNGLPFQVIGSDGGLLAAPEHATSILLGPGERADILVDFSTLSVGDEVFLVSNKFSEFNEQGRQRFSIMKFAIGRAGSSNFILPSSLSTVSIIPEALAVKTRSFNIGLMIDEEGHGTDMGRHSINGLTFDMQRIDATVDAGTTEIWEFDNSGGDEIHPMHIHGVQFQILQRFGGRNSIIATEKGWKDTVLVMPGERVRVIMTFSQHKGVFVFHCHNLEHEDDGMMLNFEIV